MPAAAAQLYSLPAGRFCHGCCTNTLYNGTPPNAVLSMLPPYVINVAATAEVLCLYCPCMKSFPVVFSGNLRSVAQKFEYGMQKRAVMDDVIRLLHLYEAKDAMGLHKKGSAAAHATSLEWRLSMALELVACPSLLIVDCAPDSAPLAACTTPSK